jgi:hypothetical protein
MGIKRSECSDAEFSAKLLKGYDEAVAAGHPAHEDYNKWRAVAREAAEPAEDGEGDTPLGGGGPGATDAAIKRRPWAKASEPVRLSLDAAMQPGRSASDSLALAEAHMRRLGYDSPTDNLYRELRAAHASVTQPRNAAANTQNAIAGYTRLR